MDAHPIDPAVRADILERLARVEQEHGVTVLYACESGSRGWGFASPDSDYDVRFLYVHPLAWYLRVSKQRDVIEQPISGVFDVNGWELRKALGLLKKGNATLIEWLDSPVVYRADDSFLSAVRCAAREVHQPARSLHHYFHMARGNHREYLCGETVRLKKYLYVLRPLLAALWVERWQTAAPMRFQDLVDQIVTDYELRTAIAELLAIKRRVPESGHGAPVPAIDRFIQEQLSRLASVVPTYRGDIDCSVLDRLLHDTACRQ